jgi:hypothetical protein
MQITFDTENLSTLDYQVLAVLGKFAMSPDFEAEEMATPKRAAEPEPVAEKAPAKKAAAKKAAAKPEPDPEPEPMAEEPIEEEPEAEEVDADETSDEDLLALAVKKATEIVAGGEAAKVREALDAAGASRVRELNADNLREFFKALS